jgi:glycosyltransferase involved in cell wall biosynthesis
MPSLSEGLPLALLEAVSNRVPCLTSNIETFKEIFTENEVPKFETGNYSDFRDKVLKFEDNNFRISVINSAFKRYTNFYTNSVMCNNYLKLYNEILIST